MPQPGFDLDSPFPVSPAQVAFYRENGFLKLKQVLAPELLAHYGAEITRQVQRLNPQTQPLEQRSMYDRAFLQVMNLWRQSAAVKEFVLGRRLAQIAATLMGVNGVRLYHDQALYKEPGGGVTPWHADQYYWPVASDKTCTAWVPLQPTPLDMGPLAFCPKSQTLTYGRDLEIGEESEIKLQQALAGYGLEESAFDLGEVSFHSGWTFHRAGVNKSSQARAVMTIIYMDAEMRLATPKNPNQVNDHQTWCPGAVPGEVIATPLNPVVYDRGGG